MASARRSGLKVPADSDEVLRRCLTVTHEDFFMCCILQLMRAAKQTTMGNVPLYEAKSELFRTLGHPVRIRVLELLQSGPRPVRELLSEIEVEASNLSQQLAVLRRAGLVRSARDGVTVLYSLATPDVAELLLAGRRILAALWTEQQDLLADLRESAASE